MDTKGKSIRAIAITSAALVLIIMVAGIFWVARSAARDTEEAVHKVSLLYLDELAGRREEVVASNLKEKIDTIDIAVDLLNENDLSSVESLQEYQKRMKTLYHLDKFAFVGESGTIYTANGSQNNIDDYKFDYKNLTEPDISILNLESAEKKAIIAVPVKDKSLRGDKLKVCFMEIDMAQMLEGVSMESDEEDATFCNIYTSDGVALSNTILGGLAVEDNLLDALSHADMEKGYSYDKVLDDFSNLKSGVASFTYDGIRETLSYAPVEGTDWLLTYLVRESVISSSIGGLTRGIITRGVIQSTLIALVLIAMFAYIIMQLRRNAQIEAEKEANEAASRVKQEEMEHRIELQNELLEQKAQGEQQSRLIDALSSDYRSVYYLDLDSNKGICYQARTDMHGMETGEKFKYLDAVSAYCDHYICEPYREEFMEFIQPENIRKGLKDKRVISHKYMIDIDGKESWEMVKFAGVYHPDETDDGLIHNAGACFADIDEETRESLSKNEMLSDALDAAEQANKAKTAFLSNMSHEIRTPMNAIIGLDSIALNDPDLPEKTRDHLVKIGDSAEHLLNLINDILDMTRIESGRINIKNEEFSFSKLLETINTIVSGQCSDKGLDYRCYIEGQVDDNYIGDKMKLRQVLINILGNAVKFTPEGGNVSLKVKRTAKYENRSTLQFTIEDNGIGISEEFIPKLFDAFSQENSSMTNKYQSSGLGLAITKNIVELMNGNIDVKSKKGEGTTFIVTVTLMNANEHGGSGEFEMEPGEMKVLVVDDDYIACEHAKLILGRAGIAAEIAGSGEEAIEMVKLKHARRELYNLILIDWKMPGMDGIETAGKIRELVGDESAIIILTAYRWDDVLEEAMTAGVDSFIAKPLFATSVIEEFKAAMTRKGIVSPEKEAVDLTGRRLLVAEDMEVNAQIMMMLLEAKGMEADLAVNGKIAVEMFGSHEPGYYDAILMDMRMPEMDGLEATRRIRALDRPDATEIPIIAFTANAFDEDVQRSLQAGLNAHLTKPVHPESLYKTLEGLIKAD